MQFIEQTFDIFPVGQGLFYSGLTKVVFRQGVEDSFRFIFDCGSITDAQANEEVDAFRDDIFQHEGRLGLLVVSHFDQDHINKIRRLLPVGKRIDKVILPFTTLAERLFLALRFLSIPGNSGPDDGFVIDFMIDPIAALGDALDGESQVTFVTGPDAPAPGAGSSSENLSQSTGSDDPDVVRVGFTFEGGTNTITPKEVLEINPQANPRGAGINTVHYLRPGLLQTNASRVALMDFIFYRRDLGQNQLQFFERVMETFCHEFNIPITDNHLPHVPTLVDRLKTIMGAPRIKRIFQRVLVDFPQLNGTGQALDEMNTSALSMLHRNRPEILSMLGTESYYDARSMATITHKRKLNGSIASTYEFHTNEVPWQFYDYRFNGLWYRYPHFKFTFPNVLLTSDGFLKSQDEADHFIQRYASYWKEFWLFQIPHHGSANNAGKPLFSRLKPFQSTFINYGINHRRRFRHPSPQVLNDLTATGQAANIYPIHEYAGIRFYIALQSIH